MKRADTVPHLSLVQRAVSSIRYLGWRGFAVRVVRRLVSLPVTRQIRKWRTLYAQCVANMRRRFKRDDARSRLAKFLARPEARLHFTRAQEPVLSILVLTYNRAEYTYRCLESILHHADISYELIIVDNASADDTHRLLERLENVNILRNSVNVGLGEGCNQVARIARGTYLLLLDNDVMLTTGCLRALVETIARTSNCGAVGCKIVTLEGRLQEAGSIIWDDGATQAYGRDGSPGAPEASYLREVDYCSRACLLVRADVWERTGGLDPRYSPACYEDVDLCMSIRSLDLRVLYQPAAVALQEYAGSSAMDAQMLVSHNQTRFADKWARKLAARPRVATGNVLCARDPSRRPALLFIDDRVDSPDFGAGMPRTWQVLTMLADMPYQVTYVPLFDPMPHEPWLTKLQQMGIEVMAGLVDFEQFAKERTGAYTILLVSRPHNMSAVHRLLRRHFPGATLVYDAEALYFVRDELSAAALGRPDPVAARRQRSLETGLLRAADLIITVSEHERSMIAALAPELAERVSVWGHPTLVRPTLSPFDTRAGLLFVGSFLYADSPNEHAVRWFLDRVFPTVARKLACALDIVGEAPRALRRRASESVTFAGFVPDLEAEFERHRIFVVPHQFSAGIPLKLIEAMSYGIPAVVSELTARQLGVCEDGIVLIGRTPEEFVCKITNLYTDPILWRRLRDGALRYVAEHCDPERFRAALRELLARAAIGGS